MIASLSHLVDRISDSLAILMRGSQSAWWLEAQRCASDSLPQAVSAFVGASFGYADTADPVNQFRSLRAAPSDNIAWVDAQTRRGARTAHGEDRYRVDGSLRMNGKSLSVPLSVTIRIDGDRASARGSAQLDWAMFGIDRGDWAGTGQIAARVDVRFVMRAQRVGQ